MTTRVRVSLGSERSDRPHGWRVAASAAGGLVGGVLLVLALGRSLAPNTTPTAVPPAAIAPSASEAASEHTSAIAPAGTAPPAAAQHEPAPAEPTQEIGAPAQSDSTSITEELPSEASAAPASVAAAAEPAAAAAVAPPPPDTRASHELVRGQIAYLRCEGVPLQDGPFPCPRDRRFEKQVWSAVERLQQCPLPAPAAGDVELRVEFRTRGRHSFEVRRTDDSEPFAHAARACLAPDLELVRTQLRPLSMTVAFRFELR